MSNPRSRHFKASLAGMALLATAACATLDDKHGYVPEESALNDVVVGRDTRDTVSLIIGRPGTTGIVDSTSLSGEGIGDSTAFSTPSRLTTSIKSAIKADVSLSFNGESGEDMVGIADLEFEN